MTLQTELSILDVSAAATNHHLLPLQLDWPRYFSCGSKCQCPTERFTNNLRDSIDWWAERNRGRCRGRYRNRTRERKCHTAFGHEKLDVDRAAIASIGWAYRYCEQLKGHRNAKDQLLRVAGDRAEDC